MSKKGGYLGGHTVIGPGSGWFSGSGKPKSKKRIGPKSGWFVVGKGSSHDPAKPKKPTREQAAAERERNFRVQEARRKAKLARKVAHEERERQIREKKAAKLEKRVRAEAANRQAKLAEQEHRARLEQRLADPQYQALAAEKLEKTKSYRHTQERMAKVEVVRPKRKVASLSKHSRPKV